MLEITIDNCYKYNLMKQLMIQIIANIFELIEDI